MRFNILWLILLLSVSTVFAQKQKFEIKGTIAQNLDGKKLYFSRLKMYGGGKPQPMTVSVTNGKFSIKGELEEPEQGVLSFKDDSKPDSNALSFIIDKGTISVSIPDKLSKGKVKGSKANEDFNAYVSIIKPETEEFNEFYLLMEQKIIKGGNRDSLQNVFQSGYALYKKEAHDIRLNFLKSHSEAFISLLLLPEIATYSQNFGQVDSLYNQLDATIRKTPSAKIISERFNKDKKLSIGAIAPEFSQANTDGKQVKLSDFRGKYVLLDFWASWCGPCRQENPNVVKIYDQFKDKNFTVLGISLDKESAKSAWLKAIEDDKLSWTNVSDLKFWQNEAATLYNVTSIPQNYLLDPQGKIIAKDLRGVQLQQALAEILK